MSIYVPRKKKFSTVDGGTMTGRQRVALARKYKRAIAKLQRERERLFTKALKEVYMDDTPWASDYFFRDQVGYSTFEEHLKARSI